MSVEARDTAFDTTQFDAIYPPGVERHYWNRCRNRVIASALRRAGAVDGLLEIGCGKGLVVAALRAQGFGITGVELAHVEAVLEARAHVRTGIDVFTLDDTACASVSTVLLLDVIEHLEDPTAFIGRIRGKFPALQRLVITVPARQELFSNYDTFNGHFRRYDRELVRRHADPEGTHTCRSSYFFHALYPAAWLQLRLRGQRELKFDVPGTGLAGLVHGALGRIFLAEYHVLPAAWWGTSIIAVIEEGGSGT